MEPQTQQTPLTRSEPNPYPTTFVQADTSSFKQVVQMLTGSSKPASTHGVSPPKSKLYERRSTALKNLRLPPSPPNSTTTTTTAEILSPSLLDFPSLMLSPVTPLTADPFNRSPSPVAVVSVDRAAEEKAIAEKGFFLHPSPVSTPRDSEPRLLPLFPVTSPRVSGSDPSS